ncbi:MAG: malonyl-CoA decarboxylase family protein [Deltaproteobacteria bacterium]|nr:malonyl-CoA decarboxylase family protein [Deltaproteobacteria bacterium]
MEAPRPSKRIQEVLNLLKEIQAQKEPALEGLEKFKKMYGSLSREDRISFFEALAAAFLISKRHLAPDLQRLLEEPDDRSESWQRRVIELRRKITSPYRALFAPFLNLPGGLKFLLDFRVDLLAAQRQTSLNLTTLDEDLTDLFNAWFQQGLLVLQEISQDSPYHQIRYLKDHDLVHPMASLEEMGRRLGADRRCFALYHQALPREPVVFIEAALTRGLARSIHEVIHEAPPAASPAKTPDTAIFYSINNTQNGLAGMGLGKVLIFQVVEALGQDNPGIKTYATLSPIPGFWDRYLQPVLRGEKVDFALTPRRLNDFFPEKIRVRILEEVHKLTGRDVADWPQALQTALSRPEWIDHRSLVKLIRQPLTELAFFYLTQEKNRRGRPLNPVANFHLSNGATVSINHVNFGANRSEKGLAESCGLMVNYIYSQTWLQQIGGTVKRLLPWKA